MSPGCIEINLGSLLSSFRDYIVQKFLCILFYVRKNMIPSFFCLQNILLGLDKMR